MYPPTENYDQRKQAVGEVQGVICTCNSVQTNNKDMLTQNNWIHISSKKM